VKVQPRRVRDSGQGRRIGAHDIDLRGGAPLGQGDAHGGWEDVVRCKAQDGAPLHHLDLGGQRAKGGGRRRETEGREKWSPATHTIAPGPQFTQPHRPQGSE
jgi:hypothetical protein